MKFYNSKTFFKAHADKFVKIIQHLFNFYNMLKKIFYTSLLLLSFLTMQCSKTSVDPNGLPPISQVGANTFGCLINGEIWIPKPSEDSVVNSFNSTTKYFHNMEAGGIFVFRGVRNQSNSKGIRDVFWLVVDSLNDNKFFAKNPMRNAFNLSYENFIAGQCSSFDLSNSAINEDYKFTDSKINISKFDTLNHIISGTFYCTIFRTGCDTIKVTDGRFDISY